MVHEMSEFYNSGVHHSRNLQWLDAINDFKKALEIDPENIASQVHLLEIYLIQNKLEDAKKIIENIDENLLGSNLKGLFYFFEAVFLFLIKRRDLGLSLINGLRNDIPPRSWEWNYDPINTSLRSSISNEDFTILMNLEEFIRRPPVEINRLTGPIRHEPIRRRRVESYEDDYGEEEQNYENMRPKKFKINEYLEVSLEGEAVHIYVNGKRFDQCKYLLLEHPDKKTTNIKDYVTMDEILYEQNGQLHDPGLHEEYITPQSLFWGHCSCIEVWVENNYDPGLMHVNLAFPLLRELSNAGDLKAKKAYENEVLNRWKCGHSAVQDCLLEMELLQNLSDDKMLEIFKYASVDLDIIGWFGNWDWDFLLKMWPSKNVKLQEYILEDEYLYEMPIETLEKMQESSANDKIKSQISTIMKDIRAENEEYAEVSHY
ncbi:MAG: tetratricopeptide repeat protein [Candidatus Hodarchaeota archaeon]